MISKSSQRGDFAFEVSEALKKRAKAITHRGIKVNCIPVKEIFDGEESKVSRVDLSFDFRVEGSAVQLRVHVWGDRWVWLDVRKKSKVSWAWEQSVEGRFLSSKGSRGLIERIETTIDASWSKTNDIAELVAEIWSACLATGPRRI